MNGHSVSKRKLIRLALPLLSVVLLSRPTQSSLILHRCASVTQSFMFDATLLCRSIASFTDATIPLLLALNYFESRLVNLRERGQRPFLIADHFNAGSIPIHDNSHTLSVPYVSSFQFGTDRVCGLSCIGGGSRLKVDQQLNTILEITPK